MLKKIGERIFDTTVIASAISLSILLVLTLVNEFINIETICVISGATTLITILSTIFISFPLMIILSEIEWKKKSKKES